MKYLTINKSKVGIGLRSPATNLKEIIKSYNWGIEQRKKKKLHVIKG
jgi:hypothetical protein